MDRSPRGGKIVPRVHRKAQGFSHYVLDVFVLRCTGYERQGRRLLHGYMVVWIAMEDIWKKNREGWIFLSDGIAWKPIKARKK